MTNFTGSHESKNSRYFGNALRFTIIAGTLSAGFLLFINNVQPAYAANPYIDQIKWYHDPVDASNETSLSFHLANLPFSDFNCRFIIQAVVDTTDTSSLPNSMGTLLPSNNNYFYGVFDGLTIAGCATPTLVNQLVVGNVYTVHHLKKMAAFKVYDDSFVANSNDYIKIGFFTIGYGLVDIDPTQYYLQASLPPTTTVSLSGTQGTNNWFLSDVTVTLSAIDGQGGPGVSDTQYSLDNGQTWQIYSAPFVLSGSGKHTFLYKSEDLAGNVEAVKSQDVYIDTVSPEATISVDTGTKDLSVQGVDSIAPPVTVVEDSSGNYLITNSAGSTTKLIFQKTYTGNLLTYAELVDIQYGNNAPIAIPSSYFLYVWNILNKTLLSQSIYVNQTYFIEALYNKSANSTTVYLKQNGSVISTQKLAGLELPELTTSFGKIGYKL